MLIDFDGTLLDCQSRLYGLLTELVPGHGLSLEEYWGLKRAGVRQPEMLRDRLGFNENAIAEYHRNWMAHIEDDFRLDTDRLFPGLEAFLRRQAGFRKLYLATNRQFRERAVRQIERLKLATYFQEILVTEQRRSKASMIKEVGLSTGPEDVFLGDTGEDVLSARELGSRAVAVSWGFQNEEGLARYQPDFMAGRVEDLAQCPFLQI